MILLTLLFTACTHRSTPLLVTPIHVGCVSEAGSSAVETRQCELAALRANGVRVIHSGLDYALSIPRDFLFSPGSARLHHEGLKRLNHVAELLNTGRIVTARILGTVSQPLGHCTYPNPQPLLDKQIRAVQAYLSDYGVSARLLYADTLVSGTHVAKLCYGQSIRIEFHDIYDPPIANNMGEI